MCGSSGSVIAFAPLAATRLISATASTGSQLGTIASGRNRSGYAPHQSSMCQSLYARIMAFVVSSWTWRKWPALKPANVGKHIDAVMPLTSMSRTRAWMSYEPGRISSKPVGSKPHSDFGHDTTAFRPTTPVWLPRYIQRSTPLSSFTTRGASSTYLAGRRPSNMLGGSTTWSSMLTRTRSSIFMTLFYPVGRMTVSAQSVKDHARSAELGAAGLGWIDLRDGGRATCGSLVYEGERLTTGYHHHDLHQIEYAVHGAVEVETSDGTYLLPPHQAAWIPAGCTHQATLHAAVTTISVLFDPSLVPAAGD